VNCSWYPGYPVPLYPDPDDETAGYVQWTAEYDHLPSAVGLLTPLSGGVVREKVILPGLGLGYGEGFNGVFLRSGGWAVYRDGVETFQTHLIMGYVYDFFNSQYTVSWTDYPGTESARSYSVRVYRELGSCVWGGNFTAYNGAGDPCQGIGRVTMKMFDIGWDITAGADLNVYGPGWCYLNSGSKTPYFEPVHTPEGTYSNGMVVT
jgi:hypothetical protein